ncbi:hypothetical protein ACRQ1B_06595 [Rhizobium panacihumi]|uniref:hypothetical protein n=1 Tax=Rhizobium panacihumi TaxID=2008450 RepID=UPI003D7993B8
MIVAYVHDKANADALKMLDPDASFYQFHAIEHTLSPNRKQQIIITDKPLTKAEQEVADVNNVEQVLVVKNAAEAEAFLADLVARYQAIRYDSRPHEEKVASLGWPISGDAFLWLQRKVLYGDEGRNKKRGIWFND